MKCKPQALIPPTRDGNSIISHRKILPQPGFEPTTTDTQRPILTHRNSAAALGARNLSQQSASVDHGLIDAQSLAIRRHETGAGRIRQSPQCCAAKSKL